MKRNACHRYPYTGERSNLKNWKQGSETSTHKIFWYKKPSFLKTVSVRVKVAF